MSITTQTPVLGIAAFSGVGKTTLLRQVIPLLCDRGLRLGIIKHSHHAFEVDKPGKDSFILRQAGAAQIVVASARRTALITDTPGAQEMIPLFPLVQQVDSAGLDIILVEGFKYYPFPKIELYRPALGHPLLCRNDPAIIAVATDASLSIVTGIPILDLNDPIDIADFIHRRCLCAMDSNSP